MSTVPVLETTLQATSICWLPVSFLIIKMVFLTIPDSFWEECSLCDRMHVPVAALYNGRPRSMISGRDASDRRSDVTDPYLSMGYFSFQPRS